jgi:hypothetical protein
LRHQFGFDFRFEIQGNGHGVLCFFKFKRNPPKQEIGCGAREFGNFATARAFVS